MNHQSQLEKSKYRNWVRGGLAYKYLKEGIEGFADDFFQQEHARILGLVNNTSGNACEQCNLKSLRPKHICQRPNSDTLICHWASSQSNRNCPYAQRNAVCSNFICDVIMEEILKSLDSTPSAPNWKNTDIHKWYTSSWEIAKCFINATGYSDKTKAAEVDASGLLHLFINNKNLHAHLSCNMTTRQNIFIKCREGRNKLFHSPAMELEDTELTECIDDIIAILEDPKELAATADAQQAVSKLKQLKQQNFIITTHSEVEVCRDSLACTTNKTLEHYQMIQEAKDDIDRKRADASKAIDDKISIDLQDALADNRDINFLKQSVESLTQRVNSLEEDNSQIKMRLLELEFVSLKAVKDQQMEKLKYVEEKQALQNSLVKLYQRHYVQTSLSPLKRQENDVNIEEVYIEPKMVVVEEDKQQSGDGNSRRETGKHKERYIQGYHDLFQSKEKGNKAIYIVGDVGAGKSSYCQMMIQDWCKAVKENSDKNATTQISSGSAKDRNIEELKKFDFLFCLSFKRMKGFRNITEMIKAVVKKGDLTTDNFIDKIFEQDSERCLILADGLDEWTPPDTPSVLQHVSYGLPERGITKNASMVTFSRPSAKGILNLKRSECDLRVKLTGINKNDVKHLVKKYLSKHNNTDSSLAENTDKSFDTLMSEIEALKLESLESCPLLLQQLVWLYCNKGVIGKSRCDVYCQIVNIMFRWSENKREEDSNQAPPKTNLRLPESLRKFPSLKSNEAYIITLGKVSFESVTANMHSSRSTFSRSCLTENGFSRADIKVLIESGILVEEKYFDRTYDDTQLSFIHFSYLEFFAAVYASCQFDEQQSDTNTSVLTKQIQYCKTAADILQLSNVLKMICGLCPFIITQVSHSISDIVKGDEKLIRQNSEELFTDSSLHQIQKLILSFLSECDSTVTNDTMVYIADVLIYDSTEMSAIKSIIPDNVISLSLKFWTIQSKIEKWMKQLKHLQYLNISFCKISHENMPMLCSVIQEAPLRCISWKGEGCELQDCTDHSIDLSKHDHLQVIKVRISDCEKKKIKISNINTEHLETIHLNSTLYIDLLQNSGRLNELHLGLPYYSLQSYTLKYNKDIDTVVHTLHQLQTLTLSRAYIDDNALTVTPEMRTLNHITLYNVEMSLETWRTFVDTLLTLQQSVQVDTLGDSEIGADLDCLKAKKEYVEEKENMFEIIPVYGLKWIIIGGNDPLCFRTKIAIK